MGFLSGILKVGFVEKYGLSLREKRNKPDFFETPLSSPLSDNVIFEWSLIKMLRFIFLNTLPIYRYVFVPVRSVVFVMKSNGMNKFMKYTF